MKENKDFMKKSSATAKKYHELMICLNYLKRKRFLFSLADLYNLVQASSMVKFDEPYELGPIVNIDNIYSRRAVWYNDINTLKGYCY
jgi:hypothetical protein